MKIALIGYSQAGKRTLFTLLTGREVSESRKPAESVEGLASIRDERVDALSGMYQPQRTVYAENQFVLCPDAVEGAGARTWLDAARRCDLVCLVLRAFESEQVYHPLGSVDASRDAENLESELLLADMEVIEKRLERLKKDERAGLRPEQKLEQQTLVKCMASLEEGTQLKEAALEEHELASVKSMELVTLIPVLRVFNVSEDAVAEQSDTDRVSVSCLIEKEIMAMDDLAERSEYLETIGLSSSGLDRVNSAAYEALGLMSFYTVGADECRAWTVSKGSLAPIAAGKIHSDIQRGFIRVEVMKFDDLIAAGSEQDAKSQGKVLTKGKDYIIEDGDICHFLFNV